MKKIVFAVLAMAMILVLSGCRDEEKKSSGFKKFEDLNVPGNKFEAYEGQDIKEKIPGIYAVSMKYLLSENLTEDERKEYSKYNMYYWFTEDNRVYQNSEPYMKEWEKETKKKFDWSNKDHWKLEDYGWLIIETSNGNIIELINILGHTAALGRYGTVNGKEAILDASHINFEDNGYGLTDIEMMDNLCEFDENFLMHQFYTKIE